MFSLASFLPNYKVMPKTQSEELFEAACGWYGMEFEPIPVGMSRTPDYVLYIKSQKVIVEVKQIDPNEEEKKNDRLLQSGRSICVSEIPGKRIYDEISDANRQIKMYAKNFEPGFLVLWNSALFTHHTAPENVLFGMYGRPAISVDVGEGTHKTARHFGPSQGLHPRRNTSTSAVGVIQGEITSPRLAVYHNVYSKVRLRHDFLRSLGIRQFVLPEGIPGKYQEWMEI